MKLELLGKARLLFRRGVTLANLTDHLAEAYGDRPALALDEPSVLTGSETISFKATANAVGRLSTAFTRAGVRPGSPVAVLPSNGADFLLTMLAVVRAGAVAVPINPALKAPEVATLLELSGATTLICDATTEALAPDGPERLTLGPPHKGIDVAAGAKGIRGVPPPAEIERDAVVAVMYTSGTTGTPKGARLTSDGLLAMASFSALNPTTLPLMRDAVTALPQAHIMGFAASLMFLYAGITHHLIPHFEGARVLDVIEGVRADVFTGVPAMYHALLDAGAEKRDLRSVKVWASAADFMPPDLARTFQSFGRLMPGVHALFVEAYGMVETSGAALLRIYPPGFPSSAPSAIAIPPYRIRVVDDAGVPVPRGETGELCVKGPGVLKGYQGDTDGRVVRDGWLRTGDLARQGLLGGITLAGRKKEVFKVGGYSVFPVEVEEEIRRHPKIADAAVVALPDSRLGHVPAAAVVPEQGEHVTIGELEGWAKDAIASYRRPRAWLIVEALPRGATRKVDKPAVVKLFIPS